MAHVQGFAERKMGDMGLFAQSVDHQRIDAFEFVELFGRNVVEIGQVGNTSDAEPQYRQLVMQSADRNDLHALHPERVFADRMETNFGNSRIFVLNECIVEILFHHPLYPLFGIDVDRLSRSVIECTHIVQPSDMVLVLVGQQDAVDTLHMFAQHLLAEVRPRIDDQHHAVLFDECGSAQPLVPAVRRRAHPATARDHRYAL